MTQALIGLLALFGSAVADLRSFYGSGATELGLLGPAQSQEAHEKFASITRSLEETEEYFGDDARQGRGARKFPRPGALRQNNRLAAVWAPPSRCLCAHPPTGPPA